MERTRGRGERGVALLIVLVVLFIVAVLMLDITLTATTARRAAANASSDFLMDAAIESRFQVALAQLRYDQGANKIDSPDDRWAREEFTTFENRKTEEEKRVEAEREEETGAKSLGDSDEVDVVVTIEDEERKFNLNLLKHPDAKKAEEARKYFVALLDRYREDTPLDLSRTRAEELCEVIVKHMERTQPGENDSAHVPVPNSKGWLLLTPDELRLVAALKDDSHGLGPEGILYDARDPEEVRNYMLEPEGREPPEAYPGLLKYVTLWSGRAWVDQPTAENAEKWKQINVNTAEKPVMEMLFQSNPADMPAAEKIIEFRGTGKEGSPAEGEVPENDEPLAEHQYFENYAALEKVPDLPKTVLETHKIAEYARFASETFSIKIVAKHEGATKQVRFVVWRHSQGFKTLLREERADPTFEEEEPEEGAEAGPR
jgi:hypothetical protein